MFDKLVVSSNAQGRGRTLGFLVGTSAVYIMLLALALALSIFAVAPRLADNGPSKGLPLAFPQARRAETSGARRASSSQTAPRPSIYNPMKLSNILSADPDSRKPVSWNDGPPVIGAIQGTEGGDAGPGGPGMIDGAPGLHGDGVDERGYTPPPPPPKATPKPAQKDARSALRLTSTVLQGKAIDRHTPAYPAIARQIRLEGAVAVEIVISPEGRVESWRAISGHALLVPAAVEAARRWRFAPTLLNGAPVRVTGIITFVFRL